MNTLLNVLSQKKMMVLSSSLVMVFLVTRALTIAFVAMGDLSVPIGSRQPFHVRAHRDLMTVKRFFQVRKQPKAIVKDSNVLHLNSNILEFNIVFAGQVTCGGQPCLAELDMRIDTSRNPKVHRVIKTMDDGNFWVQIPVQEMMHEAADWKITATTADGLTAEVHGRHLLEESVLSIDVPLFLH